MFGHHPVIDNSENLIKKAIYNDADISYIEELLREELAQYISRSDLTKCTQRWNDYLNFAVNQVNREYTFEKLSLLRELMQRLLGCDYIQTVSLGLWSRHKLYYKYISSEFIQNGIGNYINQAYFPSQRFANVKFTLQREVNQWSFKPSDCTEVDAYFLLLLNDFKNFYNGDDQPFTPLSDHNLFAGRFITDTAQPHLLKRFLQMGFDPNDEFMHHVFSTCNHKFGTDAKCEMLALLTSYGLHLDGLNTNLHSYTERNPVTGLQETICNVLNEHTLSFIFRSHEIAIVDTYIQLGGNLNITDTNTGLNLFENELSRIVDQDCGWSVEYTKKLIEFLDKLLEKFTNIFTPFVNDVVKNRNFNPVEKKEAIQCIINARTKLAMRAALQLRRSTTSRLSLLPRDVLDTVIGGYVLGNDKVSARLSQEETAKAIQQEIANALTNAMARTLRAEHASSYFLNGEFETALDSLDAQLNSLSLEAAAEAPAESDAALAAAPVDVSEPTTSPRLR